MAKLEFAEHFPQIKDEDYEKTSDPTDTYNCIAWAFGDTKQWWWPTPRYACYWPPGFERSNDLSVVIKICELHGYRKCNNGKHEPGYEKIALFVGDGVEHAARQLKSGMWTSKIGECEDIEHSGLEPFEGSDYGKVAQYLKRPRKDWVE